MGIVNLTPDSFSGDGLDDVDSALVHARHQLAAGADILDVGAESSRPGANPVSLEDERKRLLPVIEELVSWGVPISVDTYKPAVMADVLTLGVSMINDIAGLRDPAAVDVIARADCAVCIMHMRGEPRTMQKAPQYEDVLEEVSAFLRMQVARCRMAGIDDDRLVLDPGFGFGKSVCDNFRMLAEFQRFSRDGFPVLAGLSRKSMLGAVTGREAADRLAASVSAALLAVDRGAAIVRVHDVAATRDALAVRNAVLEGEKNGS